MDRHDERDRRDKGTDVMETIAVIEGMDVSNETNRIKGTNMV